jgi:hypothetical protein
MRRRLTFPQRLAIRLCAAAGMLIAAACATVPPYAITRSSWPPIAPGDGRIVMYGNVSHVVTVFGRPNWKPVIAVDGTPVAHGSGKDVYFFADAPKGDRIVSADGEVAAAVTVEAGSVTYLKMESVSADPETFPAKSGADWHLRMHPVSADEAERELDLMRYVGPQTAPTP